MSDKPKTNVAIRDWPGLVTTSDRADVPPGSGVFQVNCQSERQGELRVRRGLSRVYFDLGGFVALPDSILVSESVIVTRVSLAAVANSVSVSEVTTAFMSLTVPGSPDVIAVSDSVTSFLVHRSANTSDILVLTETLLVILDGHYGVSSFDLVTISETVSVLLTRCVLVSDIITVLDFAELSNTAWNAIDKLYLQSGQFSSVIKTSVSGFFDGFLGDISWDGSNTPAVGTGNSKLYLVSGQFGSTLKASLSIGSVSIYGTGISWDGSNTPWCAGFTAKLYLQSGQFNSTIKASLSVSSIDTNPQGISWDGTNTPWCGQEADKLYLQSGHFSSTVKTSEPIGGVELQVTGISWDGTNTPWCGDADRKLYVTSGKFSATLKTSLSLARQPFGVSPSKVSPVRY